MQTMLTLDEQLLAQAKAFTGLQESDLVTEALHALIQRESAKKLASLGGSEPELKDIPRRQHESV